MSLKQRVISETTVLIDLFHDFNQKSITGHPLPCTLCTRTPLPRVPTHLYHYHWLPGQHGDHGVYTVSSCSPGFFWIVEQEACSILLASLVILLVY